jgi:sulfatase modifying factor 1
MGKVLSFVGIFGLLLTAAVGTRAVTIDLVPVGNPGNAPDTVVMNDGTPGYGEVDYPYQIGKFEITAGQYVAFLNAVARTADPYVLLVPPPGGDTQYYSHIQRSPTPGNYVYSVAPEWANRPMNYISWGSAARYCNWLANGQPSTGVADLTTTEDGSYYLNGAVTDNALSGVTRKSTATWVIPSEDEWYKAAYYDPNKNGLGSSGYWLYPTRSDNMPSNVLTNPDPGNSANFPQGGAYTIGSPYYRTPVGAFTNSASAYGTFDQGGNVAEWTETSGRGGGFNAPMLISAFRSYPVGRGGTNADIGFRIAYIPEPSNVILIFSAAALFLLLWGRKRKT